MLSQFRIHSHLEPCLAHQHPLLPHSALSCVAEVIGLVHRLLYRAPVVAHWLDTLVVAVSALVLVLLLLKERRLNGLNLLEHFVFEAF